MIALGEAMSVEFLSKTIVPMSDYGRDGSMVSTTQPDTVVVTSEMIEHVVNLFSSASATKLKRYDSFSEHLNILLRKRTSCAAYFESNHANTSTERGEPARSTVKKPSTNESSGEEPSSRNVEDNATISSVEQSNEPPVTTILGNSLDATIETFSSELEAQGATNIDTPNARRSTRVKFAETVQPDDRPVASKEEREAMFWTRQEKDGFREEARELVETYCFENTKVLRKLERIYTGEMDEKHKYIEEESDFDEDEFLISRLHRIWVSNEDDNNLRGLEHECISMMMKDWANGVKKIVEYYDILDSTINEDGEGLHEGWEKLLRRRSLHLSKRSRKFAHRIAEADALEAKRIYKEGKFLRNIRKQLAHLSNEAGSRQ
jgi:hypothetical protein